MRSALVLASASPRRRELLRRVGVELETAEAAVDESRLPDEAPHAYASRVARDKSCVVAGDQPGAWILGADTVVVVDGDTLGKPGDQREAEAMLWRLSGRTHTVITAVCLLSPHGHEQTLTATTEVDVRRLQPQEVAGYLASGEWRGKAGAYAVQGMAAAFVTAIRGSWTNVVGLPLAEVISLLAAAGAPSADFTRGVPA